MLCSAMSHEGGARVI